MNSSKIHKSNTKKLPVESLHCYSNNINYQKCLEKYPNNKEQCKFIGTMLKECQKIIKINSEFINNTNNNEQ